MAWRVLRISLVGLLILSPLVASVEHPFLDSFVSSNSETLGTQRLKREATSSAGANEIGSLDGNFDRVEALDTDCVITLGAAEADGFEKFLAGFIYVFNGGRLPRGSEVGRSLFDTFVPPNCPHSVSKMKNSLWFILNRVWLATSCKYVDNEAFDTAYKEVKEEIERFVKTLPKIDTKSNDGLITEHPYIERAGEVIKALENAHADMERVHNSRQCNSLNIKQVTGMLESAIQELAEQKSLMRVELQAMKDQQKAIKDQQQTTKDLQRATQSALEALETHKRETTEALQSQQRATQRALDVVESQKKENRDALEAIQIQKVEFDKLTGKLIEQNNSTEKVRSSISLLETRVGEAFGAVRKLEQDTDGKLSRQSSEHLKELGKVKVELEENVFVKPWALRVRKNDTEEIIHMNSDPLTKPILASHWNELIQTAHSNKTENMDAVLAFIGKFPEKSLRLTAYEALFDSVDHTVDWKDSVRLVYKLHEASQEYNETTSTGGAGSFRGFLASKVRADFVKLMAGEYFNLESVTYPGQNLCTNFGVPTKGVLNAFTKAVPSLERREPKCLWQVIPVPKEDGKMFYLRNKVNASDSIPSEIHDNHVFIRPFSPILTSPGATTSDNKVIINVHNVKSRIINGYPYYAAYNGEESKYTVNGRETWWGLTLTGNRGTGGGIRGPGGGEETSWNDDGGVGVPYMEPFKSNTTVFAGQTAYLQCVVKHVGDKTVSWIRRRDLHILTSGNHVYTNDRRVSLLRQGKLYNSWTLKIENVQKRDEGAYECQVNTEPKLTSTLPLIVYASDVTDGVGDPKIKVSGWKVLESSQPVQRDSNSEAKYKLTEARILGGKIVRVEGGSLVNFTCSISHPGLVPPNVTWFHNDLPIKDKISVMGSGMKIDTRKSLFTTVSSLVIINVSNMDRGKYSCGGTAVYPDSVTLEIFPRHLAHVRAEQKEEPERHQEDDGEGNVNEGGRMVSIGFSLPSGSFGGHVVIVFLFLHLLRAGVVDFHEEMVF